MSKRARKTKASVASETQEQFTAGYCERSNLSREEFDKWYVVAPCDCGDPICRGWGVSHRRQGDAS